MAAIVLINPRFEVSYWGLEYALPLLGKRAMAPAASLPLLAALTPSRHAVTLVDENVEPIDFDLCARADLVGVTGMSVQRRRMREILAELKRRGVFTVVGGPWVSVQEDYFGDLADVVFVGEAEESWPRFLAEWEEGRHRARYEQAGPTDMTRVPAPRFDLLRMQDYMTASVQFSRGCPFQCEFCDIIVVFGRRPRLKTGAQVIAELEALRALGIGTVFVADDNLVGNKKAIKAVLRDLIGWQRANGYPLSLYTEASIDLADDEELLDLMVAANFGRVFVGIESPNPESLRETKKFQNLRSGATLVDKVRRIQGAGMEVWCGMIVGFDHDDASIFDAQLRFLKEARVVNASVGMLSAIPRTPLHARLLTEGRLDLSDEPSFGTNVIPLRMSRAELRDGYVKLMNDLHAPDAYFGRFEDLYLRGGLSPRRNGEASRQPPWRALGARIRRLAEALALAALVIRRVPDRALRREYRRRLVRLLGARRDPRLISTLAVKCAMHYHALNIYGYTNKEISNTF